MNGSLYINDAQTATIAASPRQASDAKQRHSSASRHGEKNSTASAKSADWRI